MSGIESCYHMLSLLLFVQAWSCREALRTAAASGVHDAFTEKIASLGAGGLHMQNAERDMHRTCRRFLNVDYQLYHVKTYLRRPGTGLDEVEWPILLPHEVFAFLFCIFLISFFYFCLHEVFALLKKANPQAFKKVFAVEKLQVWWQNIIREQPEWFLRHPLKDFVESLANKSLAVPMRLFGDETGVRKSRNVAEVHVSSPVTVDLPSLLCKIPVYIVPLHLVVKELTEPMLQRALVWSFEALASGYHPYLDHEGNPFPPTSARGKLAGQPLTEDLSRGIYVDTVSDWKWIKEAHFLEHSYGDTDKKK